MSERSYLSIGDVLGLLKDEFPDVTISKIRFLESQGLLDPERTPSGYRKFYPPDVDRLRWILRQQKENFLPLKVIKGRLDPEAGPAPEAEAASEDEPVGAAPAPSGPAPVVVEVTEVVEVAEAPAGEPRRGRPEARLPKRPPLLGALSRPVPTRLSRLAPESPSEPSSLTLEELLEATGLTESEARELEKYGLISGRAVARTVYYDAASVTVANLAVEMGRYGVEARHLRMYKTAADREASFFEQIVTPLLKQRNPRSRDQALQTVADLSALGERLRQAMLSLALRDLTGG